MRVAGAIKAVSELGELIERYPGHVLDVEMLPLSKADMKLALKIVWKASQERKLRNAISVGYTSLAHFQEGVGDKLALRNLVVVLKRIRNRRAHGFKTTEGPRDNEILGSALVILCLVGELAGKVLLNLPRKIGARDSGSE